MNGKTPVSIIDTLPRIDTQGTRASASPQDKRMQPFVHRLALLEQHVRGVQAKLYICNEDIKDIVRQGNNTGLRSSGYLRWKFGEWKL